MSYKTEKIYESLINDPYSLLDHNEIFEKFKKGEIRKDEFEGSLEEALTMFFPDDVEVSDIKVKRTYLGDD